MKRCFLLSIALSAFIALSAEVHITIDDPATWSGQALYPYVGQTVVFDVPMVVCTNANGKYTVSPWRRFQPENQGVLGTAEYNETVRINSTCMFSISDITQYHRCGEKIYNLRATVNSTSSLTFRNGEWKGNTRADLEKGLPYL